MFTYPAFLKILVCNILLINAFLMEEILESQAGEQMEATVLYLKNYMSLATRDLGSVSSLST